MSGGHSRSGVRTCTCHRAHLIPACLFFTHMGSIQRSVNSVRCIHKKMEHCRLQTAMTGQQQPLQVGLVRGKLPSYLVFARSPLLMRRGPTGGPSLQGRMSCSTAVQSCHGNGNGRDFPVVAGLQSVALIDWLIATQSSKLGCGMQPAYRRAASWQPKLVSDINWSWHKPGSAFQDKCRREGRGQAAPLAITPSTLQQACLLAWGNCWKQ